MSNWYKKIEYECDCGRNYGDCGETGKFILKYIGVSDMFEIYQQPHPNEKYERLTIITDKQLIALSNLFNNTETTKCTDEEIKNITNVFM